MFLLVGSLSGYTVSVGEEIPGYANLEVVLELTLEEQEAIESARFYIVQPGEADPLYAEFAEDEGLWRTVIIPEYLIGDTLNYFVEMKVSDGPISRYPAAGVLQAAILPDVTPPQLTLVSHESYELSRGVEEFIGFGITEESGISSFSVRYNDEPLQMAGIFDNFLSLLVVPSEENRQQEAVVTVVMTDLYDNTLEEEMVFSLRQPPAGPFFSASADYTASLDLEYTVGFGENQNSLVFADMFNDITHEVTGAFELGGETSLKAGPLVLDLELQLSDEREVADYLNAYPKVLLSDYQNIMRLWHPWNFANEFTYTTADVREYESDNSFTARISLFDPVLTYTFGDQSISFQSQTVDNLGFRGTGVGLDLFVLSLEVGKGLTDLGLYQSAWPQNFFGLKFKLDALDYWWLNTNVSFISSFQGRYDDIVAAGVSPIETLYDLGGVSPEENLVIGLETGIALKWFTLKGGLGITLYEDDASQIINTTQLANDINTAFGFDISPYLTYVDAIKAYFPVFDYFPISLGLAGAAVNRELWGVTYGGDLTVPDIGLTGWFRKTDKAYKSLGASVASDILDTGGSWEMAFGDFSVGAGYSFTRDNIPDIIFTEILPLIDPSLASDVDPTENDIAALTHSAELSLGTPDWDYFGNLSLGYVFKYKTTNTAQLKLQIDDGVDDAAQQAALESSAKNDTSMVHTASLAWKSGKIKLGDFSATLGADTEDTYTVYVLEDGAAPAAADAWDFSYGVSTSMKFGIVKLDLGFDQAWGTAAGSATSYAYDGKVSLSELFFDRISVTGSFENEYVSGSLQAYEITGGFDIDKKFGVFSVGMGLDVGYTDSLVDNTKDALSTVLEISGSISL